jgi:ribosome-associated toxin RatA of RatAB toxin-antitoxin module
MSSIQQSALVPYSAAQMYALVDDVPRYPEFLPWCVRAEVLAETETTMRARVSVAKGALSYSFTTDNLRRPPEAIELTLVDGPFKRLQGVWRFVDTPLGCKVSLALEFEFANRLLALTLSPLFKAVTGSMVNSFRQRAEALHGRP